MEALVFLFLVVPFLFLFYAAVLLYIRPSKQVWLCSLLGGLVLGVINFIVDIVAYNAHWWHYALEKVTLSNATASYQTVIVNVFAQSLATLHVPLPFYLPPIFIFGSLAYLLIWRFWQGRSRWFYWLLLIGVPVFCIVRDISGGMAQTSYQVWQNVPAAIVATTVLWLLAFYLGFFLFWRGTMHMPFTRRHEEMGHVVEHFPSGS